MVVTCFCCSTFRLDGTSHQTSSGRGRTATRIGEVHPSLMEVTPLEGGWVGESSESISGLRSVLLLESNIRTITILKGLLKNWRQPSSNSLLKSDKSP